MRHGWCVRGSVLAGVALLLPGCGGWVNIDTQDQNAAGASGGDADAIDAQGSSTAAGAPGGDSSTVAGVVSGSAGERAGAPTASGSGYSFYVVPSLVAGKDEQQLDIVARAVSENGQLIVGTIASPVMSPSVIDIPPLGLSGFVRGSLYFYWTPDTGTQPWQGKQIPACLSGDGSTIFSYTDSVPGDDSWGILRWTKDGGSQTLLEAGVGVQVGLQYCSYDGKRAAGYWGPAGPDMHGWSWAEGQWDDRIHEIGAADSVPDGAFGWVSPEGSALVVTSYGGGPNHIYWSQGNGKLELLPQPSEDCFAKPASRDGSVIVSFCPGSAGMSVYRWTTETKKFESVGVSDWPDGAITFSPDGSALVATIENQITYLKAGKLESTSADEYVDTMGLSQDGSTVYLQQSGNDRHALRWVPGSDPQTLDSLPGLPCAELTYPDADGARIVDDMVVGASSTRRDQAPGCNWSPSRAVLWDSSGARDIAAELEAAGVDLQGVRLRRADRVWADSHVRVLGTGQLSNGALRTWIAELPKRD